MAACSSRELAELRTVDRVVLVSPPGPAAFRPSFRAFLPVGLDHGSIARASLHPPVVVTSDNDPYFPEGVDAYSAIYTDVLGLPHHVIPGAGHIRVGNGLGPSPEMLAWCLVRRRCLRVTGEVHQ